jgi:hypothetical protein
MATISRSPTVVARSYVKVAVPHWRGGYVETKAVREMEYLLSGRPTASDGAKA